MEPVGLGMRTARLRRFSERLREDDGFTLAEVLSAQLIGGFVIAAAISMLIIAFHSASRVTDRVNSAAQGRIAMEEIQQRLRSQTCLYQTEYLVNSATQSTGAANSVLHAGPSKVVFFADIGNTDGNTAAAGTVGFRPQLRYIYVDPGPTSNLGPGRRATFVDGRRASASAAIPYVFNISPLTALTDLATVAGTNSLPASVQRPFAEGITNEVSGATTLPIFRYYDDANVAIPSSTTAPVSAALLPDIASIQVTFRVLGLSGKDSANPGATATVDRRTASFNSTIHLKTSQGACQ